MSWCFSLSRERKGRGVAVFRCPTRMPILGLDTEPGAVTISPLEPLPIIAGTERRIVIADFPESVFAHPEELHRLVNIVILPAYRCRIPLYLFTAASTDILAPTPLPFGDRTTIPDVMHRLTCEQARSLLAFLCIVFPTPEAASAAKEPMQTPVERMLAAALDRAGLSYAPHVPAGPWIIDFLTVSEDGRRIAVEADGRDFLDDTQQARDERLRLEYGIAKVLRFSGSRILFAADRCADLVRVALSSNPAERMYPRPEPDLSPEQAQCLAPRAGPVLTLAPAGSGKTRVLTRRVVEAVRQGIDQDRILCVVFNKAASEVMADRIHREAGLEGVQIRTLHSLGYDICRTAPGSRYAGFTVATGKTLRGGVLHLYREALKRAMNTPERSPWHIFPEHLTAAYEDAEQYRKKTLTPVDGWPERAVTEQFDPLQATRVIRMVEAALYRRRLLTFDDQIYRAVETLLASPVARRRYQHMFDVLLVDEVQDLTPVQFLFIRLLALPGNTLFAVGDDDQLINSFAGADPANIRAFREVFPGATIHTLGENHRCAADIVIRSAHLITYNRARFPKPIRPSLRQQTIARETAGNHPPTVRVFRGETLEAETRTALDAIRQWRREDLSSREIAILVRVKSIAGLIQMALTEAQIPFRPLEHTQVFTSRVARLIGAYMRICLDPETAAPTDYSRALAVPGRFLSNDHLRCIAVEGWSLVRRPEAFPSYAQPAVREFRKTVERIHRACRKLHAASSAFLADIIEQFRIGAYFAHRERFGRRAVTSSAGDIIAVVRDMALEHPDIPAFVAQYHLKIREEEDSPQRRVANHDGVRISTIHGSKGDEYRAVILFHATEDTIPHRRMVATGNPADIEEERRVFYVGVTRAIERLLITTDTTAPSRFLAELERPYGEHDRSRSDALRDAARPYINFYKRLTDKIIKSHKSPFGGKT